VSPKFSSLAFDEFKEQAEYAPQLKLVKSRNSTREAFATDFTTEDEVVNISGKLIISF